MSFMSLSLFQIVRPNSLSHSCPNIHFKSQQAKQFTLWKTIERSPLERQLHNANKQCEIISNGIPSSAKLGALIVRAHQLAPPRKVAYKMHFFHIKVDRLQGTQ